ncbi:protein of unknown function [Micrococcales bacterium KH10]|nr:protein of unknown function [Micrococcales bacterium KH10]
MSEQRPRVQVGLGELVAAVPHIAGYYPSDGSLAILALDGARLGPTVVLYAQPERPMTHLDLVGALDKVAQHFISEQFTKCILVGYGLAGAELASRADIVLNLDGVHAEEAVVVDGRRWRIIGPDPISTFDLLPSPPASIINQYPTPAPTREAAQSSMSRSPLSVHEQLGRVAENELAGSKQVSLDEVTGTLREMGANIKSGRTPDVIDVARVAAFMASHANNRDAVIIKLAASSSELDAVVGLAQCARMCQESAVPAVAGAAACVGYVTGRLGVPHVSELAQMAGAENRLGQLVRFCAENGINPQLVRESLERRSKSMSVPKPGLRPLEHQSIGPPGPAI